MVLKHLFYIHLLTRYSVIAFYLSLSTVYATPTDELLEKAENFYFSQQYQKAIDIFKPATNTGNSKAQYYMGVILSEKTYQRYNIQEALAYLTSSADQSYAPAMTKIASLYEEGAGVEKDLLIAIDWHRKAVRIERREPLLAQYEITVAGKTKPQSNTQIINEWKAKAKLNDSDAQLRLAKIYDSGRLTQHNASEAFKWYLMAANNNHQYAMFMVGYFYCRGISVELSKSKANHWLKKSGRKQIC